MKKSFLFILALALCTSLMAQMNANSVKNQAFTAKKEASATTVYSGLEDNSGIIPILRTSPMMEDNEAYHVIGETFYNVPTNHFSRNTISFQPRTTNAAAVWTMGTTDPTRGTGVNYFRTCKNEWGNIPDAATGRVETIRTGFGGHAFTINGEIIVAHDGSTGIVVNTREKVDSGQWKEKILLGPEYLIYKKASGPEELTTGLLWPTIATNGDTVHMVCVTEQWPSGTSVIPYPRPAGEAPFGYKGYPTVPLYYRSCDGGLTWDIQAHDFLEDGMTPFEVVSTSADEYALAVKGNHVVLAYSDRWGFFNYMESRNSGDTWEKKTILDYGDQWFTAEEMEVRLFPTAGAITIDENDKVHAVFSTRLLRLNNDDTYSYWPYMPTGLICWNEDMEEIDWEDIRGFTNEAGNLESWNFDKYPGYISVPSVVGFDDFNFWIGGGEPDQVPDAAGKVQFEYYGYAVYPRILAHDGRVYVSYQAPLEYPFNYGSSFYWGVFLTVKETGDEKWDVFNNTSWLSYEKDIVWADWSEYEFMGYDPITGDPIYYADAIAPEWWTDNAFPSMSMNTQDNLLLVQWYNHLMPFRIPPTGFQGTPISVYTIAKNLDQFPAYKNIREVYQGLWNVDEQAVVFPDTCIDTPPPCQSVKENVKTISSIYPNPASNGRTYVEVNVDSVYTLTVTNIVGQVVHTMKSSQKRAEINTSNYAPGIYIVNVKTNRTTSSQKLIVR